MHKCVCSISVLPVLFFFFIFFFFSYKNKYLFINFKLYIIYQ